MKSKLSLLGLVLGLCLNVDTSSQSGAISQLQTPLREQVSVINIEIPVRVLKGAAFVDHLTIDDFEVFEDGKPQKIEAVYLIQKTDIKREEGEEGSPRRVERPQLARQFVFLFDMSDYMPEVDKALDYFFDKVILPGDSLLVITPMSQLRMRSDAIAKKPLAEIKQQLQRRLRRDILRGSGAYKSTLDSLYKIINADPNDPREPNNEFSVSSPEEQLELYKQYMQQLEALRNVDEKSLLEFAGVLKSLPGQKYVYLFHQMERIPQFSPKGIDMKMFEDQDDPFKVFSYMENFDLHARSVRFNLDAVKKVYSDSSITVHFLFITKASATNAPITEAKKADAAMDPRQDVTMVEHSEDIYSAFSEVAQATGGISESSANAAAAFEKAVNASENYYLIYYTPKNYKADGKFHKIMVKVKAGGYTVTHRAGYIAT